MFNHIHWQWHHHVSCVDALCVFWPGFSALVLILRESCSVSQHQHPVQHCLTASSALLSEFRAGHRGWISITRGSGELFSSVTMTLLAQTSQPASHLLVFSFEGHCKTYTTHFYEIFHVFFLYKNTRLNWKTMWIATTIETCAHLIFLCQMTLLKWEKNL